jgi:hypothetical protein
MSRLCATQNLPQRGGESGGAEEGTSNCKLVPEMASDPMRRGANGAHPIATHTEIKSPVPAHASYSGEQF